MRKGNVFTSVCQEFCPPAQCMLGYTPPPPGADTPRSRHPQANTLPGQTPPWADTPPADTLPGQTPPGQTPPWADTPHPMHTGIHPLAQCMLGYTHPCQVHAGIPPSTNGHGSGRYASYCNAFLSVNTLTMK